MQMRTPDQSHKNLFSNNVTPIIQKNQMEEASEGLNEAEGSQPNIRKDMSSLTEAIGLTKINSSDLIRQESPQKDETPQTRKQTTSATGNACGSTLSKTQYSQNNQEKTSRFLVKTRRGRQEEIQE